MIRNAPEVKINCRINHVFCGKCCYNTEMILTINDVITIINSGYDLKYFSVFRDGFVRLRNANGHCVFLDVRSNACKIYSVRPLGCRLYPLIYDP